MEVREAQREVRSVFIGGSVGQVVSGLVWLLSVALASWSSDRAGIMALILGGTFIFLLTQLALRLVGQKAALSKGNPFSQLAIQIAFIVPFCYPVIAAAAMQNLNWFYPAFLVVVGAHYLPFLTLYGMPHYAVLSALLIGGGVVIGLSFPESFTLGGWYGGLVLVLFGLGIWLWMRGRRGAG